jgi:hypothetical protein
MPGEPIKIGPFRGGINTFSDQSAVEDDQLVECLNFEPDFDGSLRSRPPLAPLGQPMLMAATGIPSLLGTYYAPGALPYLIASDGRSSTFYFDGNSWILLTNTFAASAMVQFDNKAWMTAPVGSTNPGGYWSPATGFSAQPNMPRGEVIFANKLRLWVCKGKNATVDGTRLFFSRVLGQPEFWGSPVPDFLDIGGGDGQNIVQAMVYYQSIILFRTDSIYSFTYTTDPASGTVSPVVLGIGLTNKDCLASYENYIYFQYRGRAYEFINSRATQINVKVPFIELSQLRIVSPFSVSTFNERIIFQWWDTTYVFYLKTRTWTRWRSTDHGAFGKMIERQREENTPEAICFSAKEAQRGLDDTNAAVGVTSSGTLPQGIIYMQPEVKANATYTVSAYVKAPFGTKIVFSGRTRAPDSEGMGGSVHVATGEWERLKATFTLAAGPYAAIGLQFRTVVPGFGIALAMAKPMIQLGTVMTPWQTGGVNLVSNPTFASLLNVTGYFSLIVALEGPNAGVRAARTLSMQDGFTNRRESIQCIAQTRNYNYEASTVWKRLFWWGVEATFSGTIEGTVVALNFTRGVTWAQLRSTTWAALRSQTWGSLSSDNYRVTTVRETEGTGAQRKVVKMLSKALRFKQIYFRIVFNADGTADTSPVRLNSLMTYVRAKQTVSKTVS